MDPEKPILDQFTGYELALELCFIPHFPDKPKAYARVGAMLVEWCKGTKTYAGREYDPYEQAKAVIDEAAVCIPKWDEGANGSLRAIYERMFASNEYEPEWYATKGQLPSMIAGVCSQCGRAGYIETPAGLQVCACEWGEGEGIRRLVKSMNRIREQRRLSGFVQASHVQILTNLRALPLGNELARRKNEPAKAPPPPIENPISAADFERVQAEKEAS